MLNKDESLQFRGGGFQKPKELFLAKMVNLNSIVIEKEALHSLIKLELRSIPQLEMVPTGIQNLKKLQVLIILDMQTKFVHDIVVVGEKDRCKWIAEHEAPCIN